MATRVIIQPEPIVLPSDVPGDHAANDPIVAAMIAAVQAEIEGPLGWLGRCLGKQTLDFTGWIRGPRYRLPFPPIIDVESVSFRSEHGEWEPADPSSWRTEGDELVVAIGAAWVQHPHHRVIFRAGYDGEKTGAVPKNAKMAVILGTHMLRSLTDGDIFLQQETVTGAHSVTRNVTPYVAETIEKAVSGLLSPLRIWKI